MPPGEYNTSQCNQLCVDITTFTEVEHGGSLQRLHSNTSTYPTAQCRAAPVAHSGYRVPGTDGRSGSGCPPAQRAIGDRGGAWYALPAETRSRYAGQYVAINDGTVTDHDADQRALYLRVRRCFGSTPVAVLWAGWEEPPVFVV